MRIRLTICTVTAAFATTLASGAPGTYERDRAACMDGRTNQARDTCLREAGAARQEASRGGLTDSPERFERNRLARCEGQPPQDREDCVRRMNGEGTTSGSVEGGGIYRELVRPVVTPKPE